MTARITRSHHPLANSIAKVAGEGDGNGCGQPLTPTKGRTFACAFCEAETRVTAGRLTRNAAGDRVKVCPACFIPDHFARTCATCPDSLKPGDRLTCGRCDNANYAEPYPHEEDESE